MSIPDGCAQRFRNREWKCSKLRRLGGTTIPGTFLANVFGVLVGQEKDLFLSLRVCKEKDSPR